MNVLGKASMCIQMLELLNTGRIFKISELASLLETNPRNIVEYKKELEEAGYYIISVPGRYGGYQLEKSNIIPALSLMPEEKEILFDAYNYIMGKKDFLKKDLYTKAIGKISSSVKLPENKKDLLVIDHYQLTMQEDEIKERYEFIDNAIRLKRVIEIEYKSIKNGLKTHVLHPYKLFIYNNAWFFLAWNPEVGDVWYFKVNRIAKWKMLDEKFRVVSFFKTSDYFDDYGFKNNVEYVHIEFIISGVKNHLIKERIYGKNQIIEEIDREHSKVSLDMQNNDQMLSFILGCGTDIEVLQPDWLINQIKNIAKKIIDKYS